MHKNINLHRFSESHKTRLGITFYIIMFSILLFISYFIIGTMAFFYNNKAIDGTIKLGELDFCIFEKNKDDLVILPNEIVGKEVFLSNSRAENGSDKEDLCSILIRFFAEVYIDNVRSDYLSSKMYLGINSDLFFYSEGKYYYKNSISPGETVSLFNSIKIDQVVDNEYQNKKLDLIVFVDAVQSYGDAYKELWPEAPLQWLNNMT